jgi:O-antigen/teichoic acid export membrane protein
VTYFSGRSPKEAGCYWLAATILALAIGAPLAIAGHWLMPWLLSAQAPSIIEAAQWYLLGLTVFFALHWMPLASLRGISEFAIWNALQILPTLGWLVVLLLAVSLRRVTPQSIALGYIAMLGLMIIPVAAIARQRISGPLALNPSFFRPMLGYGLPSAIAALPQWLWSARLPQIFMAAFLDPRSLGLFTVANSWGNVSAPLTHAIGAVIFPDVVSKRTDAEKAVVLARGVQLSIFLAIISGMVMLLLTPYAVPILFGLEYAPAVPAAILMTLAGGVVEVKIVLAEGIRGFGRPKTVLITELIGLGVTVVWLIALLPSYGMFGASIAVLVGHLSGMTFLIILAHRITERSIRCLLLPTIKEISALFERIRANSICKRQVCHSRFGDDHTP